MLLGLLRLLGLLGLEWNVLEHSFLMETIKAHPKSPKPVSYHCTLAMMMRQKAGGESRIQQEKAQAERKKNLLVMLYRHLISCGYLDASVAMERECNIGLAQWEMADNMDLYYVL